MIQVEHLCKSFYISSRNAGIREATKAFFQRNKREVKALNDISFTIHDGEMVGYIGPNGAGKSSTIKVLSGILVPTSGNCIINGRTPWKQRTAHVKEIGVVFGQRSGLWWDVPVEDSFLLLKDIYQIPHSIYQKNCSELVELLHLEEIIKTPVRQLSLGQRMRCEIAAALLHDPKILFLDEPTIGLDAVSKLTVRKFIKERNELHKTTVILTTHDMQDIDALSNRILLIGKGKLLLDGSLSDIKNHFGRHKEITIEYSGNIRNFRDGITVLRQEEQGEMTLKVDTEIVSIGEVIQWLGNQVELRDLSVQENNLDEIVTSLYRQYEI